MKPLGDAFIKMIKMVIAPIIFFTVVHGIASMKDMKKVGRVGLKALIYFEVVTTLALIIGLIVVNLWKPGVGMNVDLSSAVDTKSIATLHGEGEGAEHDRVPDGHHPLDRGRRLRDRARSCRSCSSRSCSRSGCRRSASAARRCCASSTSSATSSSASSAIIMKLAPIGAFGAMAFTIGKYGVGTLLSLGNFMLAFYATCLLFIFWRARRHRRLCGFSILKFIRYIKEELLIVLGTSSSESVLPRMIAKMENLGCEPSVVGLVIPTGYSFNLDGTCIYLTMAAVFLAQATNTDLTLWQELGIIAHPAPDLEGGGRASPAPASSCSPRRSPRSAPSRSRASPSSSASTASCRRRGR